MEINQSLLLEFTRWALQNGADIKSGTELLTAIQNKSGIVGGRISNMIANSMLSFREKFLDIAHERFGQNAIANILAIPKTGSYQWSNRN